MAVKATKKVKTSDGKTHTVQIGSKADAKYSSQGATSVGGSSKSSGSSSKIPSSSLGYTDNGNEYSIIAGDDAATERNRQKAGGMDTRVSAGSGIVRGSSDIVADENNTKLGIKGMSAELPEFSSSDTKKVKSASQAIMDQLDDYMTSLSDRADQEVEGINTGFDIAKDETKGKQTGESGQASVGLARIGGYLGGSGSGTGVMLTLAKSHRDELTSLEAKRQSAIREARNAAEDKIFEVAKAKLAEAKDLQNTIYERQKDFWNRQLQASQENRAQDTYLQDKYKNELSVLAMSDADISPEKEKEIDSFYGVSGFTKKYIEVEKADAAAKSEKAKYESFKTKIDLLKAIPKGVPVQFGDETITGMGSAADISTFHVEDKNGNVTLVTHNQATGAVSTQGLGQIGTPSSDGNSTTPTSESISDMTRELNALIDDQGYVTPENYKEGARTWLESGKKLTDYEANFKIYADPSKISKYDLSAISYDPSPQSLLLQQLDTQTTGR